MKINFLFSFLGDLSLIIAHELWRQECTLLMAQQQILGMIQNSCRAVTDPGLVQKAKLWLLS